MIEILLIIFVAAYCAAFTIFLEIFIDSYKKTENNYLSKFIVATLGYISVIWFLVVLFNLVKTLIEF